MAGNGPAPKDPSQRARRNASVPMTRLPFVTAEPPALPDGLDWHPMTRKWWRAWQESPLAALMSEVDWYDMLDTALMHHKLWTDQQWTLAAEIRLRLARFGGTPVDRLKLRIQWADADKKDEEIPQTMPVPSRERYGKLVVHNFSDNNAPESE